MSEVRCILDARTALGESPVWSAEEQALYWVDVLAPALYRLDLATGARQSWWLPELIGSFGLRAGGGAVLALRNGLHLLDFQTGALTFLTPDPEDDQPTTRLNDGKVSPDGRFWVGSMDHERHSRPLGGLYRLDPITAAIRYSAASPFPTASPGAPTARPCTTRILPPR